MGHSILIIDDSALVRQQILTTLRKTTLFETYHEAADGMEGFKAALNQAFDVIVCDLEMPGMDGFKFLAMRNARGELKDVPVIMLTGREDLETKIRGLDQGASDYVTKPFDPAELMARVRVQLKIKTLQDALKKSNQLLLQLSNTDPLTSLHNRRYLMDTLDREVERSCRTDIHLSLVMVDIDHFKRVNDTYGHQVGDAVLVAVAALLQGQLRPYDTAARFGGEEFVLVLPSTELAAAGAVAERLRKLTANLSFAREGAPDLVLTISAGVAVVSPGSSVHADDLIRQADTALYRAKQDGRNRVVLASP
ncbi:response regulator receiver modulated diguanylate cyclase [Desulfuromonas soudanensis]|uniref:diguanylate cyclase n=1 Tax=Desulfuromonas soudanensis TaxID=1603606 RepID=A0A0M5IW82_9BACT|nr:diguanylate cyclase [Desulfuromonas soudanensis]ALC17224.1 response regulator receiver modulated diguanylate cyclase [Desulfuromonas soudanensis]